jgi:hypothetical protein
MATTTANLGLTLPTPNVDSGWGSTLNTDFTLLDDLFTANGSGTSVGLQVGSGKVLNAGGTIIAGGTVILGSGDGTNTVAAPTIRGAARTGTNAAGANLTIDAANGTGTGGSGKIVFRTAPVGTTGTVANTMASVFEVNSAGSIGIAGANYGSANQVLLSGGSSATPSWSNVDGSVITIPSQAQGDILYRGASAWERLPAGTNGQLLRTNGAAANPSWQSVPVQGASQAFSGSSITFTSIPAIAKMITIPVAQMGTASSVNVLIRLGTSSGVVTTGYQSAGSNFEKDSGTGGDGSTDNATNGFLIKQGGLIVSGTIRITNVSGNTWVCDHTLGAENNDYSVFGGGRITLSGVLDRVQLATVSGNFDAAGSANILYL